MTMPVRPFHRPSAVALLVLALFLAGCGGDEGNSDGGDASQASLPQPKQAGGAITDMPTKPGPGEVPLAGDAPPPPPPSLLPADARFGLPPLEDNPETGLAGDAPGVDASAPEPLPADAAALVRDYYAAIAARDYPRAYAAWSDGGRSSGQTLEAFIAGFAGTTGVEASVGDPGPVEAAAGSRYVEVPVTVNARLSDGSVRRFAGRYTLRRAVVDGASAEQRAWRIDSADLREAAPR